MSALTLLPIRDHKVVSWDTLPPWPVRARQERKTVVWTNGCFGLLHVGHAGNLQAARSRGGFLVVGVNSAASARQPKGAGRNLVPAGQRAELFAGLEYVDYVVLSDERTPEAASALAARYPCQGDRFRPATETAHSRGPDRGLLWRAHRAPCPGAVAFRLGADTTHARAERRPPR